MTKPDMATRVLSVVAAAILVACSAGDRSPAGDLAKAGTAPAAPELDAELVMEGEALYQEYCASCHRADLSGDPNWRTANRDGSYPPPPHDSSGHTWHHSDQLLLELIREGSDFPESRMPTFGDILSDEEITSVVEYIKSSWGPEERAYQWQITWQESQR